MLVLLSVIEFSRVLFVVNALGEGARRGARMAVVCPINDPAIARTAIFSRSGGSATSPVIQNLTTANVAVQYLDQAGAAVGDPTSTPDFLDIRYVRVSIENFQHQLVPGYPLCAGQYREFSASAGAANTHRADHLAQHAHDFPSRESRRAPGRGGSALLGAKGIG
jgi:hypothetical protein